MFLKEFFTLRPNLAHILTKTFLKPPILYGNGWLGNSPAEFPISSLVLGFHCLPGDQLHIQLHSITSGFVSWKTMCSRAASQFRLFLWGQRDAGEEHFKQLGLN